MDFVINENPKVESLVEHIKDKHGIHPNLKMMNMELTRNSGRKITLEKIRRLK